MRPRLLKNPKISSTAVLTGTSIATGTVFSDNDGLALGFDLVHDSKTIGFEHASGHCFHRQASLQLWSLYHGHILKQRPCTLWAGREHVLTG
jgi:hypothetical protein